MTNLIGESLKILPLISENHFPKAYLAIERLTLKFSSLNDELVLTVWRRQDLDSYPKASVPICSSIIVPTLYAEREKRMMSRSLYPSVYGIILKKIETIGAKAFLKSYMRLAIEDPEYLGHRFTILMSFVEMWPKVENNIELKYLWVDRLTEFLILSFNAQPTDYSLRKFDSDGNENFKEVFRAALLRPGFFGHHLIALACLKRSEKELLKNEIQELLAKIFIMTTIQYADAEDHVVISPPKSTEPLIDIEKTVVNYLRQGPEDPHLITFADAMSTLWDIADEEEKRLIGANFLRFMRR